ncbi:hypothetical protein BG004_007850 [Podila humilis]|nr:hypothetical protein BG004_007850 [Podila humilis]
MLKNTTWILEETNLAAFGSELEKERRKDEGALETAWSNEETGVGSEEGMWVWRIENFEVVAVPNMTHGTFFSGDSYIILKSFKKPNTEALLHDIHFWLGEETTQDEAGTAAYKTVELDDCKGGVKSGFHHWTEPEYPTRLLMVKSVPNGGGHKSSVVVREVTKDVINSGDVFVLDTGKTLYQWNGRLSSGIERVKAAEYARGIESDRAGDVNVETFDEGDRDQRIFWAALGGEVEIRPAEEVAAEPEYVKKLFRLSNTSGELKFTKEGTGLNVTADMLDSDDVFILDVQHEIFVWVGANANREEHKNGLYYAQAYLKQQGLAGSTPISKVLEKGDHTMFDNALNRF